MKRQKNGIWKLTDNEMRDVCLAFMHSREWNNSEGYDALANEDDEYANTIFNTLDDVGYFDNVR